MTQDQWAILAFRVVLIVIPVAVAMWVAVYTYLSKWWKNPIGKTVVRFAVVVALAIVPSVLSLFFNFNRTTSRVAAWIDVVLFSQVAWSVLRRIPLWVRLHMDKTGNPVYTGMLPFLAQVIRRRGRPVWTDWPAETPPPGADVDRAAGLTEEQASGS